jgi:serine/threonine-protein kinase RsbW
MVQVRILGRINRDEFFGRDVELRQIVRQESYVSDARGLVVMAAPGAGASELLRQSYDQLFARRGDQVPIYFAFRRNGATATEIARGFFQSFLRQYIAYRRVDSALSDAPLSLAELRELALPSDYEVVNGMIDLFEDATSSDADLVNFCFSLPRRFAAQGRRTYPLINCTGVLPLSAEAALARELFIALRGTELPFVFAALRRQVADLTHNAEEDRDSPAALHLEPLSDYDARRILDLLARRYQIQTNEPTRDLIVQQLGSNSFFITQFMQAARDAQVSLTSFLNCQRLYVDELMGGRVHRQFEQLLRALTPDSQTRKTLLRVLHESAVSDTRKSSLWAWKKRLGLATIEFERIIDVLHACELVNSSGAFIEVNAESSVWMDYLRTQHQLEVAGESRAKVVAESLLEVLKRAPRAMARKYRREAALGLRQMLQQFNCQSLPASLFHYDRFSESYRGERIDLINEGLDAESDLIRLPQIIHVSPCAAYSATIQCDAERCMVGHGFEAGEYTEENEVVWLVAELDSKLEASRELAEDWCDRLAQAAREARLQNPRIWLIAPEGFSSKASELLNERGAFGSSRQQVQLLTARVKAERATDLATADEFEMVIPMSDDTELIAARTVEEIARRVNFRPEAINQIKTALVEACINAAEHSLSPDRKIYQRFVVEDDKLVVTVASRGLRPAQVAPQNGDNGDGEPSTKSRRGWGLKLIRTLMDEVEFQRVDDGTQLRMTKYLR